MAVAERILNLSPLADTRPDRALVYEAQNGHPEAMSVLIERYYPRISSFVAHLTYGRANAEDLTQEVFARALKALGRFNGQYQFEHWLLRIAKNLCIDEARRSLRSPELTDPGELPELEGIPAPDYVWETVSRDLVATVVHRALMALPSRQRAILIMREMEGMSYADIAQVVGTNPRGVEATLRRARIRFRMEIARAESAEEGRATCRRVLHLVSEGPGGSRSEEASAHLARCAECRRATRLAASPGRAFGFLPLFGLPKAWDSLRGRSLPAGFGAGMRRLSERVKDSSALAGLGSTAALAAPLARMAEVTAGVLVVTVVAVAPLASTLRPPGTVASLSAAPAAPLQVASVPSVAVLYRASTSASAPVYSGSTSPALATNGSAPVASINGTPDSSASGGLLGELGLGAGQNVVTSALDNVGSISDLLANQLNQVSDLAGSSVSELTGPSTAALAPVVGAVTQTVRNLTGGVASGLTGLGTQFTGAPSRLAGRPPAPGSPSGGASQTQP